MQVNVGVGGRLAVALSGCLWIGSGGERVRVRGGREVPLCRCGIIHGMNNSSASFWLALVACDM